MFDFMAFDTFHFGCFFPVEPEESQRGAVSRSTRLTCEPLKGHNEDASHPLYGAPYTHGFAFTARSKAVVMGPFDPRIILRVSNQETKSRFWGETSPCSRGCKAQVCEHGHY